MYKEIVVHVHVFYSKMGTNDAKLHVTKYNQKYTVKIMLYFLSFSKATRVLLENPNRYKYCY